MPDLHPDDAALVAAPYSPAWNLAPVDEEAWREVQRGVSERMTPVLASMREKLGVTMTPTSVAGVAGYLLAPDRLPTEHREQLVLHLHGGGYVLGGGEAGTAEAAILVAFGGYRVLSLDYRLAPDFPFPAALDDATAAWRAIAQQYDPRCLAVSGLSAGGGLALGLMLRIRAQGLASPAALSLGSPLADMTPTGDSYAANQWLDNVLVSYDGYLARAMRLYAGARDLREPELSPLYGDLSGLPPTILSTGTRDLFLSNTVRTHRALRATGVEAELHVYDAMSHAQFALHPDAPVTRTACGEIARFFDRHLAASPEV